MGMYYEYGEEGSNDTTHIKPNNIKLESKLSSYDKTIDNLNRQIDVIKIETEAKIKAVNDLSDSELEWFFTNRYRFSQDTIN